MVERSVYGPARISSVAPGSPADGAGVRKGDLLLELDGQRMRDLIDMYLLLESGYRHELKVCRGSRETVLEADTAASALGVEVESPVFGELMTCNNDCGFCFVKQLPPGLRSSLYVRDDDYRLSFLCGNFVTLTNVGRSDMERIKAERLSPLYVSLHSTEPGVRRELFGNPRSMSALRNMKELLDAGVELHVQLVLVRGVNDGEHLDRTLGDLATDFAGVSSVGVVPAGFSTGPACNPPGYPLHDRKSAECILEKLDGYGEAFGASGPFASDEFFYIAGREPPGADYYEDYPQLENGIGMARMFADDLSSALENGVPPKEGGGRPLVITAPMGLWALALAGTESLDIRLECCDNTVFGETVNVCGLITGRDVEKAIRHAGTAGAGRALVPGVALSEGRFLDGVTIEDLERSTGYELLDVPPGAGEFLAAVLGEEGCRR